jgi:UDPglucose 6-dehydrogenase/GDP-mannose 6-dehydrogenase
MRGVHAASYFTQRDDAGHVWKAPITGFLDAGCGFGGSCLPKDVTALVAQGRSHGLPMPMLTSVLEINSSQPDELLRLVRQHFPDLTGRRVAVLGLAFKPDTDDTRESPAFPVVAGLLAAGARVSAYDPVAKAVSHPSMQHAEISASLDDALREADIVVHVTKWRQFEDLANHLHRLGRNPLVVDGRRNLCPSDFANFEAVGR